MKNILSLIDWPLVTDERPRPSAPDSIDDPRPAQILANVSGIQRRRHRSVMESIADFAERVVSAARSVA